MRRDDADFDDSNPHELNFAGTDFRHITEFCPQTTTDGADQLFPSGTYRCLLCPREKDKPRKFTDIGDIRDHYTSSAHTPAELQEKKSAKKNTTRKRRAPQPEKTATAAAATTAAASSAKEDSENEGEAEQEDAEEEGAEEERKRERKLAKKIAGERVGVGEKPTHANSATIQLVYFEEDDMNAFRNMERRGGKPVPLPSHDGVDALKGERLQSKLLPTAEQLAVLDKKVSAALGKNCNCVSLSHLHANFVPGVTTTGETGQGLHHDAGFGRDGTFNNKHALWLPLDANSTLDFLTYDEDEESFVRATIQLPYGWGIVHNLIHGGSSTADMVKRFLITGDGSLECLRLFAYVDVAAPSQNFKKGFVMDANLTHDQLVVQTPKLNDLRKYIRNTVRRDRWQVSRLDYDDARLLLARERWLMKRKKNNNNKKKKPKAEEKRKGKGKGKGNKQKRQKRKK